MLIRGAEYLASVIDKETFSAKMVLNAKGALVFPVRREHRDMKAEGISYMDDYKGNALAAMINPGRIEIRFHRAFSDSDVADIMRRLLAEPELASLNGWEVTYQGRRLSVADR